MPVKLGGSSSSYNIYTDPKAPPFTAVYQDRIGVWHNTNHYHANTASFYTSIDYRGSVVQCSNLAANTYAQIMSVTGSGFLGTVIFPRLTNDNAATWTIELTIDGVVTERTTPSVTSLNTRRMVFGNFIIGSVIDGALIYQTAGYRMNSPGYWENYDGLGGRVVSTASAVDCGLVPVDQQIMRGQPVLKFNTSLSVRVKSSLQCAYSGANTQKAAALYILNP